jgi:hypothetical protein
MKPGTRLKLNIVIDIIMFVVMVVLVVIGFLIRYVLLSGTLRWEKFGRNVDMTFLGLDRHQWGYIHLIIGISLVVLLVLHIIFHWTQIVCMIKRLLPGIRVRTTVIASLTLVSIAISLVPFFAVPEIGDPIRGQGEGYGRASFHANEESVLQEDFENESGQLKDSKPEETAVVKSTETQHDHQEARTLEIKGFHTIEGLAGSYNISAAELKQRLNIPAHVSDNERLGRIRRLYGFSMREVEDCVLELQSEH